MEPPEPTSDPANPPGDGPGMDAYRIRDEWMEQAPPSTTVCLAVAAVTGSEPSAMAPLSDSVDPDALDTLFRGKESAGGPTDNVTFTYEECTVIVFRDGTIVVRPGVDV